MLHKNIKTCGIYAFQKSGITWMRYLLRAMLNAEKEPLSLVVPDMYTDDIFNHHAFQIGNQGTWHFYKSHQKDEIRQLKGFDIVHDFIIYIIRNPLDVFCSYLNYQLALEQPRSVSVFEVKPKTVDEVKAKGLMADFFSCFMLYGTVQPTFTNAGSWMENVRYWLTRAKVEKNILVVRYEDLVTDFVPAITPIYTRFGSNQVDINTLEARVNEQTQDGGRFFWKKKVGTFLNYLSATDINKFMTLHHEVLALSGYDKWIQQYLHQHHHDQALSAV